MKITYYPGCSLEETARPFNVSTLRVLEALGVVVEDIPDWSCCGSSPALKADGLLSVSLGAHNLSKAAERDNSQVVIPCPFCFRRLLSAREETEADPALRERVERVIERPVATGVEVRSLPDFVRNGVGLDAVRQRVRRPLTGMRVLPYYGCYLVKPPGVTRFDDPENPVVLDEILEALGAEVMDWDFKTECCGAGLAVSNTETVCDLSGRVIREAVRRGADALVVACQLCQANLDLRQPEIGRMDRRRYAMPVLYFTQLMGLAFGIPARELGLHHHLTEPAAILAEELSA